MSTYLSHLQSLAPTPLVVVTLAVAVFALTIYDPVAGKRQYTAFLRAEAAAGEKARLRFYRSWILQGCATAILAIGLVLALPDVGLAEIGLRTARTDMLDWFGLSGGDIDAGLIVGMLVGAAVGGAVLAAIVRRRPTSRTAQTPAQIVAVQPMLPRTGRGRWAWAALSLSAGVTEEITYRGLLVLTLAVGLPSGTPVAVIIVLAATVFGAAHWYQGRAGMLSTGIVGAALTALYLATGSLLVPMILHTLMDLRVLLVPAENDTSRPEAPVADPAEGA